MTGIKSIIMKTIFGVAFVTFGFIGIFSPYMINMESVELHYFLSSLSVIVGVGLFYDKHYSSTIKQAKEQRKLSDERFAAIAHELSISRAKHRGAMRSFDNLVIQKRNIEQKNSEYKLTEMFLDDLVNETLAENRKLKNQIKGLKLTLSRYKKNKL